MRYFRVVLMALLLGAIVAVPAQAAPDTAAACVEESVQVQPERLDPIDGTSFFAVNVPMPTGCGTLIFDGQERPDGGPVLRIFGLPVDKWGIVAGTWWAIRSDIDPQSVALRIAKPSTSVEDMRLGGIKVLKAPQAVPGVCSKESTVVTPTDLRTPSSGLQLALGVPIPGGYTSLLFDGQMPGSTTGSKVIFGSPIASPGWLYVTGTWYAICGDPVPIAKRIAAPTDEIHDMRQGGILIPH
ncbi:MAG: hypothetical protein Q7S03_00235 [bacterium]|nr:hypothetical protein [bacterium]